MGNTSSKPKKRTKLPVHEGVVHIFATFNNTIITITDGQGNTIVWASPGGSAFKNSRKSTPYAAQVAAEKAGVKARDERSLRSIRVVIKGAGPGRDSALRAVLGLGLTVTEIVDRTPIPHNGCRPEKRRRV